MAEHFIQRRRVLVALDPCAAELADFEATARLAAGMNAELVGLFVEDSGLIEAADLPVTQLIPAGCGSMAAVDASAMRRAFRVAAARAHETLSTVAERWQVQWSFQIIQLAAAEETLSRLTADDLLALSGAPRARRSPLSERAVRVMMERLPCPVLVMRREGQRRQPVAVLYEGNAAALAVGRDLARIYERPLLVVVAGEDAAARQQREREAAAWLRDQGLSGTVRHMSCDDGREAAACLRAAYPGLVVIDRRGALGGALDLDLLAEQADASVLVLGAS
jgi:hypothetical protein